MKDFEDMTFEEREEILEHIRNLQDESPDSIDIFAHSFNALSSTSLQRQADVLFVNALIDNKVYIDIQYI